jgi:hypothetical protein
MVIVNNEIDYQISDIDYIIKGRSEDYVLPEDKVRYSQPYRERLHPTKVITPRRCRIRNRPNSGHSFKNNKK